jgi:hypothetical protein
MNRKATISSHLTFSEQSRDHLEAHFAIVGQDRHRFEPTVQEQGSLFLILSNNIN